MILIDTNVLSEALKPAPAGQVVTWLDRRFPDCAISSVTTFELLAGVALLDAGRRRDALENTITRLTRRLAGRVFRIGHLGSFNDLMLCGTLCGHA